MKTLRPEPCTNGPLSIPAAMILQYFDSPTFLASKYLENKKKSRSNILTPTPPTLAARTGLEPMFHE